MKVKNSANPVREQDYVLNLARLQFYKKYFGTALLMALLEAAVIALLSGAFIWVKSQQVEREYFAVDSQTGRIIPLAPLSHPYLSDSALLTWAQQCITDANTYDFVNYQKQFQRNAQCFTAQGWKQFMVALERSGTLATVKTQRLVAQAIASGAAVITRSGPYRGVYRWEIEQPVTVTYQGGQAGRVRLTQRLQVTLRIARIPTYASKQGVGIVQYVAQEQ